MTKEEIKERLRDISDILCENIPCYACKYAIWDKDDEWICSFQYIIDKLNEDIKENKNETR